MPIFTVCLSTFVLGETYPLKVCVHTCMYMYMYVYVFCQAEIVTNYDVNIIIGASRG